MDFLKKTTMNFFMIISLIIIVFTFLTVFKIVTPLVVISGSMEPVIPVGSLIVSKTVTTSELEINEIASLPREDGVLVTHRIISNNEVENNESLREIVMKGDANDTVDQIPYVASEALTPIVVIPGFGSALTWLMNNKLLLIAVGSFSVGLYLLVKMIIDRKHALMNE